MARVRHRLKLMADYQCFPLWWHGGRSIGMIEPDALPLSEPLKRRLSAWAAVYDGLMQTDYQWPTAAAQAAFVREAGCCWPRCVRSWVPTTRPGTSTT